MNSPHPSALFVTFEGLDFSGKSTQVARFAEHLAAVGSKHVVLRDPGGTAIGERIRSILLDRAALDMAEVTELFLFSASRAQLAQEHIRPNLESGTSVVCDRFYDSTTAYQGSGRGLPLDVIATINRAAAGGLVPDLTLFFDIPVAEIEQRMIKQNAGADRMEMSGREFYERVRRGFLRLASEEPRFEVIDGLLGPEEIHAKVWARYERVKAEKQQAI